MSIFGESSLFSSLSTSEGATSLAITFLVLLFIIIAVRITNLPFIQILHNFVRFIIRVFGRSINKREAAYHRDVEIGKITEKRAKVKLYRFLSELIIDLGLIDTGITPYELLTLTCIIVFLVVTILCKMLFGSLLISALMSPIAIVGTFCVMYTKANITHDARIEAVIEAENIICNNIKVGVVVAVRESLDVIPKSVRPDFKDFIDNVEQKNYHIKTALLELNARLGSVADDFIKKCIVFELEEEHGIAGMFQDLVEINNIQSELRTAMKREFERVKTDFVVGASMIFAFLAGVIALYPTVRTFYFKTAIGQFILAVDALLLILEYVYITYLRAQEL
jgi:hypothetical protein